MCLIARYLEERGISTICVVSALDIVTFGLPPRAAFMDFPLGHGGGPAFNSEQQLAIAREAMYILETAQNPGEIIHMDQIWPEGDTWKVAASDKSADDVRQPRDMIIRYEREEDRELAEVAVGN